MPYTTFRDFRRRTIADKVLCDKTFNIDKNSKYDEHQRDKKFLLEQLKMRLFLIKNKQKILRKFNKRKVRSPFRDKIWGANLADMELISKFNERFRFLLCN